MADAYWSYADGRTAATVTLHQPPPVAPQLHLVKRPRPDFPDVPSLPGYPPRMDQGIGQGPIRDTKSLEASYEHYLRNGVPYVASFGGVATEPVRQISDGLPPHSVEDRLLGVGLGDAHVVGFGGSRPELPRGPEHPLPPDASNTLYVEGMPANSTRREVSHIFRPFVGFREVRLVNKGSKPSGEPLVLCFVDFAAPAQAAIALDALQGYKFDEHDQDSSCLRLQFARFPGPRSGGGPRGRR